MNESGSWAGSGSMRDLQTMLKIAPKGGGGITVSMAVPAVPYYDSYIFARGVENLEIGAKAGGILIVSTATAPS